jgi:chemotaxis response regulator CheB
MNDHNENLLDFTIHCFGTKTDFEIGVDTASIMSTQQSQATIAGQVARVWVKEKIASWRDPAFQTKTTCVKWAYWPGGKTCIGWKTETRHYTNEIWVTVSSPSVKDLQSAVERALSDAAVVAAIIGISTGGTAAVAAFKAVFNARLTQEIKDAVIDVSQEGTWGAWG